jgi:4-alpha-glucanotransferase
MPVRLNPRKTVSRALLNLSRQQRPNVGVGEFGKGAYRVVKFSKKGGFIEWVKATLAREVEIVEHPLSGLRSV